MSVPLHHLLSHLRRVVQPPEGGVVDSDLLQRYAREGDTAAFDGLVRRHGAMVLGVCRRILGSPEDAEDAFQATWLVLIRRASSLRTRKTVGDWLYGVAYRTAQEARRANARRRAKEAAVVPRTECPQQGEELRALLDAEIAALPAKYREVIVLSELEGRARKEVASLLGCPEGTVASRLARARTLLAKRLTRQGHTLSVAAVAAILGEQACAAPVPLALATALLRIAAAGVVPAEVGALAQGVLKAMFIAKLQGVSALVLVVGLVGTGGGWLYYRGVAAAQPVAAQTKPATAEKPATAQAKPATEEKPTE